MQTINKNVYVFVLGVTALLISFNSCRKFVEVKPPGTNVNSSNVFDNDATAIAAMTSLYIDLSKGQSIGTIFLKMGLAADELDLSQLGSDELRTYYKNDYIPQSSGAVFFWTRGYQLIYKANAMLEGLNASKSLSASVKQQLLGEAKFMRAFAYFYLVNLYGDVPIALTTDYKVNTQLPRSPESEVYTMIIADLQDAQKMLHDDYAGKSGVPSGSETERIRPNRATATALLARVYLYNREYASAEAQATQLISNSRYKVTGVSLDHVFLMNSDETIWSLQPVGYDGGNSQYNTFEGMQFILPPSGPNYEQFPVYLNHDYTDSLEIGDQRKVVWFANMTAPDHTIYDYSFKYKGGFENTERKEYSIVFRLAEQFLIRAECRAKLGDIAGAADDLNVIRYRAGLSNVAPSTESGMLHAIQHERLAELFTEWGHRWFDLKRTGQLNTVMFKATAKKGGVWQPYKALFPIPQSEILTNPNLTGHQNPGYN